MISLLWHDHRWMTSLIAISILLNFLSDLYPTSLWNNKQWLLVVFTYQKYTAGSLIISNIIIWLGLTLIMVNFWPSETICISFIEAALLTGINKSKYVGVQLKVIFNLYCSVWSICMATSNNGPRPAGTSHYSLLPYYPISHSLTPTHFPLVYM